MKRNIFRALLSAVLMMCCMVANAAGTQPSGEGTSANPYQIATLDNLLWFADYVNQGQEHLTACAILTADITMNSGVLDSNGNLNGDGSSFSVWTPIGSWGSKPNTYKGFAGEFNGNGHTISGLYFNDETKAPVGLFGMADQNGYIHDVGITDSYFCGKSHVAGICGDLAYGRIENCWNGATVIGNGDNSCAGGIAGSCWIVASVNGCYNIGKISVGTGSNSQCGGICGTVAKNNDPTVYSVSNCVSLEGKCDSAYNKKSDDVQIIDVYILDTSAFASGEVCWLLNGNKTDTKWRQQIGKDSYPVWTGNYLVNHSDGKGYYNETMCEKENGIHNFEKKEVKRCDNSTFVYWHCNTCDKDFTDADRTKEEAAVNTITHFPEYVMGIVPTETTEGRYGYYQCTSCHKNFIDEQCTVEATEATLTVPEAKNNEIWYTTTDNKKLTPYATNVFGATYNDANNVYNRGLGKITFDKDVTSIGKDAFFDCSSLKSISVPNSVTSIGEGAFKKCSQLQSITIPGSVKSMGRSVFSDCTSLKDVTIEDGAYIGKYAFQNYNGTLTINGSLSGVDQQAFDGCTGLTSVSIKGGDIGQSAFYECVNLGSVTLHDGVTGIGEYAFIECSSLKSISVPNSVTSIGEYAFSDCSSLKSISVPNSVTSIGDGAFKKCSQLQSITIPGSVKSMGWYVFYNCSSLNNVTIEDGAYIGRYAFQNYNGTLTINGSLSGVDQQAFDGCTGLTSVSIKSGGIGNSAFKGCTNLITVSLLDGVTGIGTQAFKTCSNLEDITVKWTEAENIPSIDKNVFDGVDRAKATLHVPTNTTSLYQAKDIWKDFRIVEDVNFIITKTDDTKIEQKGVFRNLE